MTPVPSIADLQVLLREFSTDREWGAFHSPKNLAMAIAAEAGELLAELQWLTEEQSWDAARDAELRARIIDELADVAIYLLRLCDVLEVDLAHAVQNKIARNEVRFPVPVVRGRAVRGRDLIDGG